MRKRTLLIMTAVVIAIGSLLYSCENSKSKKAGDATVKVGRGDLTTKALAVGNIIPQHSIAITSSLPGIVAALFHYEGDYVHAGDPLLQVKPSPRPQDLAEAKRNLEKKRIDESNAVNHAQRLKQLLQKGYATKDEYATAFKDAESATIERKMAEEKLALMQKGESQVGDQIIKSIINSPIDGFILARNIDVGDSIVPQTDAQKGNILFTIANMTDLLFSGQISEIDAGKIREGMRANITIGALPDTVVTGKIHKISLQSENLSNQNIKNPSASSNSTTNSPFNVGYKIEISELKLPPDIRLRSGYSATADIIVEQYKNILLIPERVLIFRDNKVFVKLAGKPPQEKEIKIGASDGINAQVVNGLKEGETVLDNVATLDFTDKKHSR